MRTPGAWRAERIWGTVPRVIEMQSEGGCWCGILAGTAGGGLTTTFTASQGLLLMLPDMYKIAGELTSAVFHVARSVAAQALSIFVTTVINGHTCWRGFRFLHQIRVQEAMDMAPDQPSRQSQKAGFQCCTFFDGVRTPMKLFVSNPLHRKLREG